MVKVAITKTSDMSNEEPIIMEFGLLDNAIHHCIDTMQQNGHGSVIVSRPYDDNNEKVDWKLEIYDDFRE